MAVSFSQTFDQFEQVKKAAVDAVNTIFPVQGKLRKVLVDKVWVDDKLDPTDYKSQASARMRDSTWGVGVYAHLKLYERGKLTDEQDVKLFTLPKPTQRHSYIVGGKEYQVQNQLRLKPGVYTLRKQNGELKTQVNLARGKNFDLGFDEAKGLFTIQKIGGGQANIPLFPILQHLGIGRAEIAKAWGERITSSNQQFSDPKAVEKAESAFKLKKDETLKSYLDTKTQIDPQTTKAALGHSFEKVDGFLLLSAAKQLLDVHMGRQEPTDRDSLEYKSLLGIDDFIKERLEKNKTTLSYKVKRNIDSPKKNKLSQIVGTGAFSSVIEGFFTQDDKANFVEQTNPLEMITGTQKVTIMGAGGIGSTHAITPDMRQVHSSHFGLIDPIHTPESDRTGVNLHLPIGAVKDGNELKTTVVDKQGKTHYLSPVDMKRKTIAFPGQKGPKVKAMKNGQTIEVDIGQVDYFIPSPTNMFSWSTNLIPFLPSAQGNRAMMAAKMMEQAISLKNREAPLVQSKAPDGRTMENIIGEQASVHSPIDGTVVKVTEDQVFIKPATGGAQVAVNLYKNFLLNGKSFLNNEVTVKVGDKVTKGQLLADSNYTKNGTIALGTNLKTAYIPYKGYNFDDGIVVSEAAAKKLTSEHLYKKEMALNQNISTKLDAYKSHYPNALEPSNLNKLDNDGVIKKGEKIKYGEAYVVGLQQRVATADVSLMSRMLSNRPKDISMIWTNEDVGTVIDVIKSSRKITVIIKTEEAAKIGDKLAGRHGNKGVITKIIPDGEMPQTKGGEAVDMLLNPLGITSRINISQIYESAAGKAAGIAGKPVEVSNFTEENYLKKTKDILKKAGTDDEEELIDPATGKSLGSVHVGMPHILKLYKQTAVNYSARQGGPGHGYDANLQPLKAGGEEGAKSLDMLTMYSMLSHGARHNLREMASIKGSKNDEFWKAMKAGEQLPPPPTPFVFDKFLNYLKGAGIDVKKDGTRMTLAPLTDSQIKEMSSGEITKPLFFRSKDMQPIKGGFFDPVKTGGFKGTRWGHMDLVEPVVNPPFENAVKKLTGLGKKYEEVVSGKMFIANDGTFNTEGKGITGAKAIESLLKNIDVKAEIRVLEEKAKRTKGSSLDDINKRLRYLTSLDKLGLRPEEAYIRKTLPVVPPNIRPVYPLPDGNITSSDVNYLYRNVGIYNTLMKSPVMDLLAEEDKSDFRKDFHTTVKAVSGLTDINIAGKPRDGFIGEIKGGTGGQPKEGLFQRKILSKQQDYVGRGTIIPEPSLGVDEMAMPEPMAWKLFEPFVVKELRNHGLNPNAAMEEIKRKTPLAKKALEIVMKDRHVLLNRAPSLHKYSIMAFKPKVTDGKSIKIPPLVNKGFNADHDGDEQRTSVLTYLSDVGINLLEEHLRSATIGDEEMAARFREVVGLKDKGGDFFLFDLEDFPHTELLSSSEGEKGRIDFYRAPEGTKVLSYDEDSNSIQWKDVFGWSKHYQREIEIVCLRSGRQIVTDDDPRAVYGVPAGNITPGRFTPSEAVKKKVLVPRMQRGDFCLSGKKQIVTYEKNRYELTADLGHFIGSVVSNGWVETCHGQDTGRVFVCCMNEVLGETFIKTAKSVFDFKGKELRYHREDGTNGSYGEAKKWGFLHDGAASFFGTFVGHGAKEKHLPPFFLSANEEFRNGLFAGLMDHDGSIAIVHSTGKNRALVGNYQTVSLRLAQEIQWLAKSLGIRSSISSSKTPGGSVIWQVGFTNFDLRKWGGKGMLNEKKLANLFAEGVTCNENSAASAKADVVPIHRETAQALRRNLGAPRNASKEERTTYAQLSKAVADGHISRIKAKEILSDFHPSLFENVPHLDKWAEIVKNSDVTWDPVVGYENTGIYEDGYDLTVPGFETFMNVEGVVLSNTMTIHVPITNEANNEAAKMTPSRNLFQPGSGKIMITPDQEAQVGIYYLSKKPEGRKQLEKILGPGYTIDRPLDKGTTAGILTRVAKEKSPNEYSKIVSDLKSAGENKSYEMGFSVGLRDLPDFSKERKAIIDAAKKMISSGQNPSEVNKNITDRINKVMETKLQDTDNPLYDMVISGAKGKKDQIRSLMVTPLFVADAKNNIVKNPIGKSYIEGLDAGDYWTSMSGARKGMMDRAVSTMLPGSFSKDIMATTVDNIISMADCGTHDGVQLPIISNDALERFVAGDQNGVPHNSLVDSNLINRLKAQKVSSIKVRSPLKCRAPKGTCAYCYGLDEHNQIPEVGENIGAKSGQTIAEPLIQITMNSFHSGGAAGTGAQAGGLERVQQLLQLPKTLVGAAALSPVDGTVTKIVKGLAGGFDVYIGDRKVHVSKGRSVIVKVGIQVKKGDILSDGPVKPQELAELKGVEAAQDYITDALQDEYKSQGIGIARKTFETVVRSLTNTTQVTNNPKHADYLPGDILSYTVVNDYNSKLKTIVDIDDAVGYRLTKQYGTLMPGKEITDADVKVMKSLGMKAVEVEKEPIEHKPFVKGILNLPLTKGDWMASLGYRNLAKVLTEGAAQGWQTDVENYHPIPPLAHATTFGKGKGGKY